MEIKNETLLTYQLLTKLALSTRRLRICLYITYACLICMLSFELYYFATTGEWIKSPMVYFTLVFPIVYHAYLYFMTRKTYKKLIGGNISRHSYIFKDEEIESNVINDLTKDSHATYPYNKLTNIEIKEDYIFLYLTRYMMFPIDKKGFASESERDKVIALLKEKVKK